MDAVMRIKDVCKATGLGKSTIYRMIAAGDFPPPIKLGARSAGWLQSEINEWIEERVAARA